MKHDRSHSPSTRPALSTRATTPRATSGGTDGLGSVQGEVDPNGTVTASRKFDVYGLVRGSSGTSTSRHKFVGSLGHTSEDETGLLYMRARYYDPQIGRFASEDPGREDANWFTYCQNDPVNKIDESGRSAQAVIALNDAPRSKLRGICWSEQG